MLLRIRPCSLQPQATRPGQPPAEETSLLSQPFPELIHKPCSPSDGKSPGLRPRPPLLNTPACSSTQEEHLSSVRKALGLIPSITKIFLKSMKA